MRKVLGVSLQRLLSPRSSSGPCPTLMNLRCVLFQFFCPLAPGRIQLAPLEPLCVVCTLALRRVLFLSSQELAFSNALAFKFIASSAQCAQLLDGCSNSVLLRKTLLGNGSGGQLDLRKPLRELTWSPSRRPWDMDAGVDTPPSPIGQGHLCDTLHSTGCWYVCACIRGHLSVSGTSS